MDEKIITGNNDDNNHESSPKNNNRRELNFPRVYYISAVAILLLLLLGGNAIVKNNQLLKAQQTINDIYSKSFLELADSVNEIDIYLAKGAVSNSPAYLADLANKIHIQSSSAISSLGQLPISHVELDKTSKFLSQVGDYTYSISKKATAGEEISAKEKNELAALSKYASSLSDSLYKLEDTLFKDGLSFDTMNSSTAFANSSTPSDIGTNFEGIEENFQDYPSLIYDGPFSDHINRQEALHLKGMGEISKDRAEEEVKKFLGKSTVKKLTYSGSVKGTIEAYKYIATDNSDNRSCVEISKNGGFVVFMLKNRNVNESKLSVKDAVLKGSEFLISRGIHSMTESYYEIKDNVITINYAYVEDGVIMYPDLVKVKIALDNGEILGFESQGYLMAHTTNRQTNPVEITIEEARQRVSPSVNILSSSMAVIPKNSGTEVLCYEFITTLNDKKFIIYINATTGEEEQILMLIENEDGVLTL